VLTKGRRRHPPPRKRGPGAASRTAILDAARGLWLERGPRGVSARKIAEAVGLSPTAIYLYFRNIEEVREHLRLEGHALLAGYLAAAGRDLPAVERIRAMGRAYHRFGLEHPQQYALMFNVRAEETPRHEALVREMQTLMQLRRAVEEGIARGEVRADLDPMVTTNALWAQIHGVTALTVSRLLAETTHGDEAAVVEAVLDATAAWIARRTP
jgi:AcrR family transcriptional regulator